MIVVKVGGSLYDHPGLGPGLRAFLGSLAPEPVLVIPGGGPFADAVRGLDAAHRLGEERAHWLALSAMRTAGRFLEALLREAPPAPADRVTICDCLGFALADESRPGRLPHSWSVTSDSIAARVAVVERADRLILLKSVDVPRAISWPEAVDRGWVDPHFPAVVAELSVPVEVIEFRRRLASGPIRSSESERKGESDPLRPPEI